MVSLSEVELVPSPSPSGRGRPHGSSPSVMYVRVG